MGANGHATTDLFGEPEQLEPLTEFAERIDAMARALQIEVGKFRTRLEHETRAAIQAKAVTRTATDADIKSAKHHPVKAVMTHFDLKHQAKFNGDAATFTTPQDPTLIKRLIDAHGEERVRDLIDDFFALDDEWLARTGYTIGNFQKRVPGLISSSRTQVRAMGVTPRTANNQRYASSAADRIRRMCADESRGPVIDVPATK